MIKKESLAAVFTALGCIGTIASVLMAVHDTPMAIKRMDDHRMEIDPSGQTDLAFKEKVVDQTKSYWKTGVCTAAAITFNCIGFALSHKAYKELLSLSAAGAAITAKYKDKALELFGEEKAKLLDKAVKEDLKTDEFSTKLYWFQEPVSGEFFQSTLKDIYEAEYEANKRIRLEGYTCIGDIFPQIKKKAPKSAKWVWCNDQLVDDYGYPWLDFVHSRKNCMASEDGGIDYKFNDGRETYVINYGIYPMPYKLAVECGYEAPY